MSNKPFVLVKGAEMVMRFNVHLAIYENGALIHEAYQHNIIVDEGLNLMRNLVASEQNHEPNSIAVGTGTTAVTPLDTALETEVFRNQLTQTQTSDKQVTFQLFITETQANGNTLTESGLINQNATLGDQLWGRVILDTPIIKTAATTATITWTITFARDE